MKFTILLLSAILTVVLAKHHPLSDEFIAEINQKATTWKAGRNFDISQWEHVKRLASGSYLLTPERKKHLRHQKYDLTDIEIPEYFDSAEKWPECESIREIRDQSRCGSCWAFAAVEAMSDRICIHSNATLQTRVSSMDLTTCCTECGDGCQGGYPEEAWQYWEYTGISTGGLYNRTDQGCKSYFLPECDDHPHNCEDYVIAPSCSKKCDTEEDVYSKSMTYGVEGFTSYADSVEDIQYEIMTNGPVETSFTAYADFASYKSGIYQQTSDEPLGGHAVKFVGWGVENGVKYWKVANSWNPRWGENGYFRIIRGTDECEIEEGVVFGLPKLQ